MLTTEPHCRGDSRGLRATETPMQDGVMLQRVPGCEGSWGGNRTHMPLTPNEQALGRSAAGSPTAPVLCWPRSSAHRVLVTAPRPQPTRLCLCPKYLLRLLAKPGPA